MVFYCRGVNTFAFMLSVSGGFEMLIVCVGLFNYISWVLIECVGKFFFYFVPKKC